VNGRQQLFIKYYTDGPTKGNATQSAIKAGYKWKYANQACKFLLGNLRLKQALNKAQEKVEWKDTQSREYIDREFHKRYEACIDKNKESEAIRCLENQAKNRGYYAEDNAQRTEARKEFTPEEQAALAKAGNIIILDQAQREHKAG
jgi:phage terminase small subunit